jgi:hypothetical protein
MSRNPLIHNGATNATWSGHFYPEAVPPWRSGVPGADLGESLATANFYEKALFVKPTRGGRCVVNATALPFALCFYPHCQ